MARSTRLDRQTLGYAKPDGVQRLARFVGVPLQRKPCSCARCTHQLIEALVRRLDAI